jgi:acyl-CoA synthetase (AMP-forming)/AMP-acid ligase II
VVAAGFPDPEWGQRVVVWVVPTDPLDRPTLQDLRRSSAATLASHEVPRGLVLVDELPRTPSGKVRRSSLPSPTGPGGSTEPE